MNPPREQEIWDVAVAGAGASGLLAAAAAAQAGARTILLEKNPQPGAKISLSGGGRCNVTAALSPEETADAFDRTAARFLRPSFAAFGPDALRALLEEEGVRTVVEPEFKKVFPASGRAQDVLDALVRHAMKSGAVLTPERPMEDVNPAEGCLRITTRQGPVLARAIVMSCGGASWPKTGCAGDGYRILARLGHRIVPIRPALVALRTAPGWMNGLAGISAPDALVSAIDEKGKVLRKRRRPVLFTHRGLSGPGIMDISSCLTQPGNKVRLRIDWFPDTSEDDIAAALSSRRHGSSLVARRLPGGLPERLLMALMRLANVPDNRPASQMTREERLRLLQALKRCDVPIIGDEGFDQAEVTAGGVALEEVDRLTMESRLVPGLFICGELLDVDGPVGGFNIQAAASTGRMAGVHAAGKGN
jgi:predicted Rossmann fold flavoprotein